MGPRQGLSEPAFELTQARAGRLVSIVTSPPYSFAIDYLDGDESQLEFMGCDADKLRASMVGLRGRTMVEKVRNYMRDMGLSDPNPV